MTFARKQWRSTTAIAKMLVTVWNWNNNIAVFSFSDVPHSPSKKECWYYRRTSFDTRRFTVCSHQILLQREWRQKSTETCRKGNYRRGTNYVIKVMLHNVDVEQCCRFQNRFWKLATCCRQLEVTLCAVLYAVDFEHNNCRIKHIAIDHEFLWFIGW